MPCTQLVTNPSVPHKQQQQQQSFEKFQKTRFFSENDFRLVV
jgi:hypothetical protein